MPPSDPSSPDQDPAIGLKLVDESAGSGATQDASPSAPESAPTDRGIRGRSLPAWLFAVALIVFSLAIGWQAQLAGELEAEVAGLEAQLEHTSALLDAHRTHLSEVRGGVHELSERLQGLRSLVDRDPTAKVPEMAVPTP
jgi:hypothetical protein